MEKWISQPTENSAVGGINRDVGASRLIVAGNANQFVPKPVADVIGMGEFFNNLSI
jgi:hypothetical protein